MAKKGSFMQNMWDVLQDPDPAVQSLMHWEGDNAFEVHEVDKFTETLLPRLSGSQSVCSFVRQLNGYGFKKVGGKRFLFEHAVLDRRDPTSLSRISRRKAAKRRSSGGDGGHKAAAGAAAGDAPAMRPVPAPESKAPGGEARVAGQEGEPRGLLTAALATLKQIASSAAAVAQFSAAAGAAPSPAESLLTSTVQHAIGTLLASQRPDLVPPAPVGAQPGLLALDGALSSLLSELNGGRDAEQLAPRATHGKAAVPMAAWGAPADPAAGDVASEGTGSAPRSAAPTPGSVFGAASWAGESPEQRTALQAALDAAEADQEGWGSPATFLQVPGETGAE